MRVVSYCTNQATLDEMVMATDAKEVFKALGYLAAWGLDSYDVVHIYVQGPTELLAQYEGEGRSYTIGAIWQEYNRQFGFHS